MRKSEAASGTVQSVGISTIAVRFEHSILIVVRSRIVFFVNRYFASYVKGFARCFQPTHFGIFIGGIAAAEVCSLNPLVFLGLSVAMILPYECTSFPTTQVDVKFIG